MSEGWMVEEVARNKKASSGFISRGGSKSHGFHEHLEIVPGVFLGAGGTEQVGGVIGHNRGNAPIAMPATPELSQRKRGIEEGGGGDLAQEAKKFGPEDRNLTFEERQAVRDLVGEGVSIVWGARFQDVGDINLFAREAHALGDHVSEQHSRAAHEGEAGAVFVGTRCFAHKHEPRGRRAGSENRLGASGSEQRASHAACDLGGESRELRGALGDGDVRRFKLLAEKRGNRERWRDHGRRSRHSPDRRRGMRGRRGAGRGLDDTEGERNRGRPYFRRD